ncbi:MULTISPECIES: hypothetical protein [unclassified Vibrio]|uniref:Uncharacterized protein n=1 Tax=Vibrio sp. HB236076 TaxID=3232307 RepID=A0AB39HFS1_9VIBR|nr:hypothetical protein [Vibrio sp. HB161653]MDP5253185.1 hypothetical protein [Vibrio sp. HB161653]
MLKQITAVFLAASFIAAPAAMAATSGDKGGVHANHQADKAGQQAQYIKIVGVSEHNNQR